MSINLNLIVDKNPISYILKKVAEFCPFSLALKSFHDSVLQKMPETPKNLLVYLGAFALSFWTLKLMWRAVKFTYWMPGHFLRNWGITNKKLTQKYGDGYVLITGCTDGIGLAYAEIFASMGFNLVLVARNKTKLEQVIRNIKAKHPDIETETVIADLGSLEEINKLTHQLQVLMDRIDIGIVVNCAGISYTSPWVSQDASRFVGQINVNFIAPYRINKVMIPRLQNRMSRSAIINVSSCVGYFNSLSVGIYPSLKRMLDIYSRTLSQENKNIDIISARPFGVRTKMVGYHNGPLMISPEVCALATLADLGSSDFTYTGFKHKLVASVISCYSEEEAQNFYRKSFDRIRKRTLQRKNRKE